MSALLSPVARQLFLNPSTGQPASGFKVYTYEAGSGLHKQDTYTDSTGGTPNTNPIILDSLGEADIWLTPDTGYKFVFSYPTDTDPPTNSIWTVDQIFGSNITAPISPWAIATGTPDAIAAAYDPVNQSLPDGLLLGFRALGANTTATPTFTPDSQPTYVITDLGGQPLAGSAIPGANAECLVRFNLQFTRWELLNPAAHTSAGTELVPPINARMGVGTAAATGTFTADLLSVATSLAGTVYLLPSYSQTINLATTGPGGMDTGAAPVSGFVSLYAIYDPTSNTTSILACNATTSSGTIYSGANMPSGYTASYLIGIWPTTSMSLFVVGGLVGKKLVFAPVSVLSAGVATSYTSVSLVAAVPTAAIAVDGFMNGENDFPNRAAIYVAATNTGVHELEANTDNGASGHRTIGTPFTGLAVLTAQTMYYKTTTGGSGAVITICAYVIP